MWLIFFVVVLVIAFLMVFLLMAIRMLTGQAKLQLNRYFLKNLETYDRLAENKNEEIDRLQEEVKTLEERVEAAKARLNAMAEAGGKTSGSSAPSGGGTVVMSEPAGASYRDPGFLEDYAYVRRHMKIDSRKTIDEVLKRLNQEEDPELALCQDMLSKLPAEHLYDVIVMPEEDQIEYLKELFDDEEDAYLDRYVEERGVFDLLEFQNFLTNYVKSHENEVYIRTGSPEELADLESSHVHVLYDEGVHEGIRISYKNTVYDFSL